MLRNNESLRLGVVLPARNESQSLPNLIDDILSSIFEEFPRSEVEIIVVDDGSTDNMIESVTNRNFQHEKFAVSIISFTRNFGKESAMYAGLQSLSSKMDRVIVMDSDGQHPVVEMVLMLRISLESNCCVVGVQDHSRNGPLYRWTNKILHAITSSTEGASPTGTSDFRVLTQDAVEGFLSLPERSRFSRELFDFLGLPTVYYRYNVAERLDGSKSRWGRSNLFGYAITSITTRGSSILPKLILAASGLVLIVTIYAFIVSVISVARGEYNGTASILFALVMFQILQFIFLFFISSIVVNVLVEVKQRPLYVKKKMSD